LSCAIETVNIFKKFNQIKGYKDLVFHPFRKKEIIALKGINIQVRKGELFGLLGPNGAGKTTLIKILSGLILPTKGNAYIHGYDVAGDGKQVRGVIGYVVNEERSFYWRLTGRQNLGFFATLNNLSPSQAEKRIDELITLTGLDGDADRIFKDYSTGMKQRLAIARGLITSPEVLLMDEPTRSLDPSAARHLRKFIKEKIVGEDGKTVFLATHNLSEAEELCDRIAIINQGEIKTRGTLTEIGSLLNTQKVYFMELKDVSEDLVSKLRELPSVNKILCNHSGFSSDNGIEMEITINGNGDISAVIERIVHSGGKLLSCYPHKASLGEIFSEVIEKER
jgi:ABC-2 type transport system ATP-binding protein